MSKQLLNFIGRGSAFNTKEGNTSAFLKDGTTLFLIDCGEDTFSRILDMKILKGIEHISIFITHLHSDHYASLSSLIYYCHYILKLKPIIYTSHCQLNNILKASGHNNEYILVTVNQEEILCVSENISFYTFRTNHTDTLESDSLVIFYLDNKIYYSGDSNEACNEAIREIMDGKKVQYYQDVCTSGSPVHLSIEKLINVTRLDARQHIYCMHLDSDKAFFIAKENGLNIVKLYSKENIINSKINHIISKQKSYLEFCDKVLEQEYDENSACYNWYSARKECLLDIIKELTELI